MVPEYDKLWKAYKDLSDRIDEANLAILKVRAERQSEMDALRARIAILENKVKASGIAIPGTSVVRGSLRSQQYSKPR